MKYQPWMTNAAHGIGALAIVAGVYLVARGSVSAWWFTAWLVGHMLNALTFSVGLHRLFTHRAFAAPESWHTWFAAHSTTLWHGSTLQWAAVHVAHHKHSDTDLDPHVADWSYFFHKRVRGASVARAPLHLLRSSLHRAVHDKFAFIAISMIVPLACSPQLLLYGYLMPLGSYHIVGALHTILAHHRGQPRSLPLLELLLPAAGEWYHREHHEGKATGALDWGWGLAQLIRSRA